MRHERVDGDRIELLFPLREPASGGRSGPWPATDLRLEDWSPQLYRGFGRVARQLPVPHAIVRDARVSVEPALGPRAAALGSGTVTLMVTPQGDATICLSVAVAGSLDMLLLTLRALRDRSAGHRVLVGGETPLDALRASGPAPLRERLERCSQVSPVAAQHVCVVDAARLGLLRESPAAADVADAVDLQGVGRLLYYDALPYGAAPIRRAQSGIAFPALANRYAGTLAAVSANGSVVSGHADGLVAGMVLANVIAQGAKQRAGEVRAAAYADLVELTTVEARAESLPYATDAIAAELGRNVTRLAERTGHHRVALAFGAEAYLDVEAVVPSSVIGSYHRAVVAETRAEQAVATASVLIDRLDEAVAALRAVVTATERALDEARTKHLTRVGGILAAIALVLTFVFGVYGSNAAPIGDKPLADFRAGYLAFFVLVLALAYVIGAIYRGSWRLWGPATTESQLR